MYRVYLVDDDAVILEELRSCVSWLDNGFEIVGSATSSVTALEEIPTLQADLVISDLRMAPYDGIQLMQLLRLKGITPYFLMISAYASFENSRRFFLEGGFDYLLKPFEAGEVQLVLCRLYQILSDASQAENENKSLKGCNPVFRDLLAYLQENYQQKHTLESLGKQFGLSPNYICTLFSKHCDTTLTHYLTSLRMAVAKGEIETGTLPLKAIASLCGYNDYRYFNRVFKDYFGVSPGKFNAEETEK